MRTGRGCSDAWAPSSATAASTSAVAAVGRRLDEDAGGAVMIVTADSRVPQDVVDKIVATDGFVAGRTVSL